MSIQKKSLISTLKSAKKANVVKEEVTASASVASPVKALRTTVRASRCCAEQAHPPRSPRPHRATKPDPTALRERPRTRGLFLFHQNFRTTPRLTDTHINPTRLRLGP